MRSLPFGGRCSVNLKLTLDKRNHPPEVDGIPALHAPRLSRPNEPRSAGHIESRPVFPEASLDRSDHESAHTHQPRTMQAHSSCTNGYQSTHKETPYYLMPRFGCVWLSSLTIHFGSSCHPCRPTGRTSQPRAASSRIFLHRSVQHSVKSLQPIGTNTQKILGTHRHWHPPVTNNGCPLSRTHTAPNHVPASKPTIAPLSLSRKPPRGDGQSTSPSSST